jgi:hypothetical protein
MELFGFNWEDVQEESELFLDLAPPKRAGKTQSFRLEGYIGPPPPPHFHYLVGMPFSSFKEYRSWNDAYFPYCVAQEKRMREANLSYDERSIKMLRVTCVAKSLRFNGGKGTLIARLRRLEQGTIQPILVKKLVKIELSAHSATLLPAQPKDDHHAPVKVHMESLPNRYGPALDQLPHELLRFLFGLCEPNTLLNVLLVSKYLFYDCQFVLEEKARTAFGPGATGLAFSMLNSLNKDLRGIVNKTREYYLTGSLLLTIKRKELFFKRTHFKDSACEKLYNWELLLGCFDNFGTIEDQIQFRKIYSLNMDAKKEEDERLLKALPERVAKFNERLIAKQLPPNMIEYKAAYSRFGPEAMYTFFSVLERQFFLVFEPRLLPLLSRYMKGKDVGLLDQIDRLIQPYFYVIYHIPETLLPRIGDMFVFRKKSQKLVQALFRFSSDGKKISFCGKRITLEEFAARLTVMKEQLYAERRIPLVGTSPSFDYKYTMDLLVVFEDDPTRVICINPAPVELLTRENVAVTIGEGMTADRLEFRGNLDEDHRVMLNVCFVHAADLYDNGTQN